MVTVNGEQINYNNLFDFSTDADRYCVPTDTNPPTITISYSSSVLLTEIGIQGIQVLLPFRNRFVRSFSLSYDAGNDTVSYISANGLTVCVVSYIVPSLISNACLFCYRHLVFLMLRHIILACGPQLEPLNLRLLYTIGNQILV